MSPSKTNKIKTNQSQPLAHTLPAIVAGPMLRHCNTQQMTLWLVTTKRFSVELSLYQQMTSSQASSQVSSQEMSSEGLNDSTALFNLSLTSDHIEQVQIGDRAFVNLINVELPETLIENTLYSYDLRLIDDNGELVHSLATHDPDISYKDQALPSFVIKSKINQLYHGSCRKPHYDSGDGLVQLDNTIAQTSTSADERPSMLIMSGDQVYVDDVAGPMLSAIHQTISLLGLYDESWDDDEIKTDPTKQITDSQALFNSQYGYYHREQFLPHHSVNPRLIDKLLGASKQPIFTSVNAKNHLVTFSEMMAMYILVWSPDLWPHIDLSHGEQHTPAEFVKQYHTEKRVIEAFVKGLAQVKRALAHVPVYMIFDDHDVTDDWNLTRGWEEAAYNHPFSKRIIGNALLAYYFCQGWGNAPHHFDNLDGHNATYFTDKGIVEHDVLLDKMLAWDHWHYHLDTSPKLLVLDTRTQRWRSESNPGKPSGLMDWETLTSLQQELINQPCVIMVSAAPVYGVKLIEAVQRIFTFFGKPLAVDAENWMAHSGTANVMLNIFRHHKTPPQFIILSGDVHYSFVYDVSHRFIRNSSRIVQITCSGIKNTFPDKLLHWLERLNRLLYGTNSPLNWFTKRRRMKIKVRKPSVETAGKIGASKDKTLFNGSGIGLLTISDDFETVDAQIITETGERVYFKRSEETT